MHKNLARAPCLLRVLYVRVLMLMRMLMLTISRINRRAPRPHDNERCDLALHFSSEKSPADWLLPLPVNVSNLRRHVKRSLAEVQKSCFTF